MEDLDDIKKKLLDKRDKKEQEQNQRAEERSRRLKLRTHFLDVQLRQLKIDIGRVVSKLSKDLDLGYAEHTVSYNAMDDPIRIFYHIYDPSQRASSEHDSGAVAGRGGNYFSVCHVMIQYPTKRFDLMHTLLYLEIEGPRSRDHLAGLSEEEIVEKRSIGDICSLVQDKLLHRLRVYADE